MNIEYRTRNVEVGALGMATRLVFAKLAIGNIKPEAPLRHFRRAWVL